MVIPSPYYICKSLVKHIASHPLILSPPDDSLPIIDYFKLFPGLHYEEGIICSIYPYYGDSSLIPINSSRTSTYYEPYNMGNGEDHIIYNLVISLQHNSVMIPGSDIEILDVQAYYSSQVSLTSNKTKPVQLVTNPSLEILSNYVELLRLVIGDKYIRSIFNPIRIKSIEVVSSLIKGGRWETQKNVYFHEAEILVRLDGYLSRGWLGVDALPIENININITEHEVNH